MKKREYITPSLKVVNTVATTHMLSGSFEDGTNLSKADSRRQESWDDDEDEIEDSMWK